MAVLYLLLGGKHVVTQYLIKGVRVLGGEPADLLLRDGVIAETGRARVRRRCRSRSTRTAWSRCPAWSTCTPTCASPAGRTRRRSRPARRAAALGGYTAVCAMANTDPVADTAGVVEQVYRLGREAGLVDVQPVGAVTVGLARRAAGRAGRDGRAPRPRVRIFSDDGHCVADPRLMRRALEYVKAFDGVIAQHAEEPRLTEGAQMHEGEVSARLGLAGWPAVAEEAIIARDVLLAEHVDARLHVCHVSTAGSVEILRWAKARGIRVTAEVTPHHLLLTDELAAGYDPVFKVNPPLRTSADVAALRAALAEGVIDVVATDHAPHAVEDKECEWAYARPGMLGLQTALPSWWRCSVQQWDLIAERMSRTPARIAGLTGHGQDPVAGAPANLTLVDPAARWVVDPAELASRSRNTPYAGMTLPARVVATFLRGSPTVLDGKAVR